MTDIEMTCERFEERLADYMEGDVHGAELARMDAHAASCVACGALVADLRQITADAAALAPIEPPATVWAGIESRIATAVVPIASRRRTIPLVRALTAAAAMILVTATVTYLATVRLHPTPAANDNGSTQIVASLPPNTGVAQRESTDSSPSAQQLNSGTTQGERRVPDAAPSSLRTVAHEQRTAGRSERAAAVYDEEISRLRSVLKRREDLDPKTVAAIQRSLAVIDTAITQARAAVAADPASAFLNKRLADAQNKKVELLRTAAMLPST